MTPQYIQWIIVTLLYGKFHWSAKGLKKWQILDSIHHLCFSEEQDERRKGPLFELFMKLERSRAMRQKNQKGSHKANNKIKSKYSLLHDPANILLCRN